MLDDGRVNRIPEWLRPSRWGLRVRSAIVAALVVGAVLLAAAGAMLLLLRESLLRELDSAAVTQMDALAPELSRISAQESAESVVGALPASLFSTEGSIDAVQVIDPRGRVLRSSDPKTTVPLLDPNAVGDRVVGREPVPDEDDDLRVSARSVYTPLGRYTVMVAVSTEPVEHAVTKVAALVAVGGPIVVAAAAAATYLLVGRSLRSVEVIRRRVTGIGATDLSERVPVPAARDEIARLAETMNAMLARIEAGHLAQRRFVGDASHELRSPLAAVAAALELARDRPEVLDRELIDGTLLPETERMRHLIEDLLTLAAADEHRLELRTGDVDLDDLAAAQAAALRGRSGLTIRTDIRPTRVIGDPAKLARALRNIADNAAAHADSKVAIAVDRDGEHARVVIDDDGPGIPVADRARVFDRFVRLEPDRARASGGSGLGLAIVAELVAAHGGSVSVGESPWGGARFVILLPVGGPRIDQPVADAP
ncbi:ATP-binding protein [Nocardia sp. NBC_01503]|uniref:sensor histidine kinase n=1 Tax=Nocardia sp. NBC_01503 TaxID=2975997 RepID=UPI002E7BA72F|nr:ATP-binding protein [Nocardia sp. NBC_01503]WTL31261.1 ATP-binding protein [Nocardia sp. NBC_01503]